MSKDNKYLWPIGLFLLSLTVRLALLDYTYVQVIEADGVSYIAGAKGFWDGFDISKISIIDHPLFGILIAFFSPVTPDWEMAGRMVSIVSGSFIGPLVFLISKAKGNSLKVSIFSGLFVAVSPLFVTTSYQVFNDSLNCAVLLVGVWQVVIAFRDGKGKNFFLSGLAFALAYLTRPDSIVPSFFAFLYMTYYILRSGFSKKGWTGFSVFAVGFAVLSIPYLLFLHAHLGKWVVTGRQIAANINLPAYMGGNYEDANYGLRQDLGLKGDVFAIAKAGGASIKKGFLGLWMENPQRMLSSLIENLKIEWDVYVSAVPWYIKILAIVGIVTQWRGFIPNNLPLFVYSSPLFFLYPFFWADVRHILHFLLPLWLWAAEGVASLSTAVQKTRLGKKIFQKVSHREIFNYSIYIAIVMAFIFSFNQKVVGPKELNYLRQKETGIWISKNTPKDAVVMARWGRLTFYTDRKTVVFPYADWEMIKRYMKKNGVTHLVVDESFFDIRPQVRHLLTPIITGSTLSPDDSLSITRLKRDEFGGMIVYEVRKN